jgi:menaquinone-dependent protoporphyrinogen IX oxidase
MNTLLAYATEQGSSKEIALFMQDYLQEHGHRTMLYNVMQKDMPHLNDYDAIILGAPIYRGIWHKHMLRFSQSQHKTLLSKHVFAWMTCVRVLEPGGMAHARNHYIPAEVSDLTLRLPMGIFSGRLTYENLTEDDRWAFYLRYDGAAMMRELSGDFRDWKTIGRWISDVENVISSLSEDSEGA